MKKTITYSLQYCFWILAITLQTAYLHGQDMPIFKHFGGTKMDCTCDALQHLYIIKDGRLLIQYNEHGDSVRQYNAQMDGPISKLDVTNPLSPLLYHGSNNKIVLLDRVLTKKTEIDLKQKYPYGTYQVAMSADGHIWLFNSYDNQLLKFDQQLNNVIKPNDLRMQFDHIIQPKQMFEVNRELYVYDPQQGVFIFDVYGTFIKQLAILNASQISVVDNQIVYQTTEALRAYDMLTHKETLIHLPEGIQQTSGKWYHCQTYLILETKGGITVYNTLKD